MLSLLNGILLHVLVFRLPGKTTAGEIKSTKLKDGVSHNHFYYTVHFPKAFGHKMVITKCLIDACGSMSCLFFKVAKGR